MWEGEGREEGQGGEVGAGGGFDESTFMRKVVLKAYE